MPSNLLSYTLMYFNLSPPEQIKYVYINLILIIFSEGLFLLISQIMLPCNSWFFLSLLLPGL